ncbi:MAG: extracellular solute-binding protein [Clostridiales bacterium]|nr:extracellular solute-binding protein [Clostridiales bacterium]
MKKILALVLAMLMALSLVACGSSSDDTATDDTSDSTTTEEASGTDEEEAEVEAEADAEADAEVEETDSTEVADSITLWTYPIGGWGTEETVNALIEGFTAETGISVTVEYLDYTNGDEKVNTALAAGEGPDLIMEGPERLVADWGASGYMVDISDLLDDTDIAEINAAALDACYGEDGAVYEYPLVMTAHCMAINKTVFEAAGAMQYLDEETHLWNSSEDFFAAVQAVYEYTGATVGAIYCGGQGGDQGTRALVNNLYGGTFASEDHTSYTWNSEENIQALEALVACEGIEFDASIVGGDEIAQFYQGTLNMAFCWNIAQQLDPNTAGTGSGLTLSGDEILFMAFPTEDGSDPELCGGIWGFGIFNNGDDAKIAAAKLFIQYMCDSEATADAVTAANYFAVRDTVVDGTVDISDIWADNEIMNEYNILMQYLGDYYQVTTNWTAARYQWWNMLQVIGAGGDVTEAVETYATNADNGISE